MDYNNNWAEYARNKVDFKKRKGVFFMIIEFINASDPCTLENPLQLLGYLKTCIEISNNKAEKDLAALMIYTLFVTENSVFHEYCSYID